jgi:pilus assembly protein CpaF
VVLAELRAGLFHRKEDEDEESLRLLALDWTGSRTELLIGRNSSCDIRIDDLSVSRQHARLVFRDGAWVLQDLQSTNGTLVNGTRVGRCRLRPGDRLVLGQQVLQVD